MENAVHLQRLLRGTSLAMVAVVGLAMLEEIWQLGLGTHLSCFLSWLATFGWCTLLFWFSGSPGAQRLSPGLWMLLLATQTLTVIALVISWKVGAILLVLTAWQAGQVLNIRGACAWALGQALLLILLLSLQELRLTWLVSVATSGVLGLFAVIVAHLARSEAQARQELSQTVVELKDAQELLGQASRHAERMHLARELHDGMGHRLTALSLNLETARQHLGGTLPEPAAQAQDLARDLLRELRSVVSTLREDERPNLDHALRALTAGIDKPRIHLHLIGELQVEDPARTHALVRCLQELITNTLKHAKAENLWVDVIATSEGIALKVKDDGWGGLGLQEGHGLKGMRERLALLGGRLSLAPGSGGFQVQIWLPYGGPLP